MFTPLEIVGCNFCFITPRGAASTMSLGARYSDNNQAASCDIAEVIGYDAVLTPEQVDDVTQYLADKFNL